MTKESTRPIIPPIHIYFAKLLLTFLPQSSSKLLSIIPPKVIAIPDIIIVRIAKNPILVILDPRVNRPIAEVHAQ